MTEATIIDRVRDFIVQNFLYMRPNFDLADDASLLDRRILDSMAVMELIVFLEEQFHVKVPERDINETNLGSLKAIGEYVSRGLQGFAAFRRLP